MDDNNEQPPKSTQRVKFFVEKTDVALLDTDKNNNVPAKKTSSQSNLINDVIWEFNDSQQDDSVGIGMGENKNASVAFSTDNNLDKVNIISPDMNGDVESVPLNKTVNVKMWHDDEEEKPLGNFLNNILNFNSLIPSNKEVEKVEEKQPKQAKLGTVLGVYLPCLQNILGVILFVRSSWIVGIAGSVESFLIVFTCCLTTFLTAISTSAIATNGIVPAGGPYFIISRSLGPECGGAVGILFYLGNAVGASMYIVGSCEILLKYIAPSLTLIGDIENVDDAFHNFRIYGTIILVLIGLIVFIGIKFVSKLAPISLVAVLVSVVCIYGGIVKSAFYPPDMKICVFNDTRLIRYDSYMLDEVSYCTNDKYCINTKTNQSFECPLWTAYCKTYYDIEAKLNVTKNVTILPEDEKLEDFVDDPIHERYAYLCHYFEEKNSVVLKAGIPGISSKDVIRENYKPNYLDKDEVNTQEEGLKNTEVLNDEFTSFLILFGIFFPSVTGIMAGTNRSGDLKDPSRSIPRGTIAAIMTTSFIYISLFVLFGTAIEGVLLRDKFGNSINKKLVIAELAWPNPWVIMVGAFLSTLGAGLQSLTGAPRLLQAIAKDDLIPFLKPLAPSYRGEPFRALILTLLITWSGILLGNIEYLTPIVTMFFLMCYGFINMACALQTILKAPSWRPRFRFYHWSLSLLGLCLCLTIMFLIKWYYAILAILIALIIYKYIEYKGAEKEWGDGIRGLSMSAAIFGLLRLEESPPHVKNWRPQILLLTKSSAKYSYKEIGDESTNDTLYEVQHPNAFAFASQLKAGKGLVVCASVLTGDYIQIKDEAKECKKALKQVMNNYRMKGFSEAVVSESVEHGLNHLIQTVGLGGLRHNTIILNWPTKWDSEYNKPGMSEEELDSIGLSSFVQTLRFVHKDESALILTKGIDSWPVSIKTDVQSGTIDLWWIISDGGLLLLIVFLLKRNKLWSKCKLRLFTVAKVDENSIQMKNDLIQYMYFLRIDAEVEVLEMNDSEISAYTYEKTLKLHEREKLLKDLKVKESVQETEPQIMLERSRRSSIMTRESSEEANAAFNHYTFSVGNNSRRPSLFQTDTIIKMHSAVELNKKILEKSKDASLVLMNIPAPPKTSGVSDFNFMSFIHASTEGLNRVLLVRGSGREVITIFS